MKRVIKIIVISLFTCFSFYYTDKVIEFSKERDPIMIKLRSINKNKVSYVNGVLSSDTMLVGESGYEVDIEKSYEQMKKIDEYNDNLLSYIDVKPSILKKDNLDKFIIGSNTNDKKISFVFSSSSVKELKSIIEVLNEEDVYSTIFIDGKFLEENLGLLKSISNNKISFGLYGYNNNYSESSIRYVHDVINNNLLYSNYCLYKNDKFLKSCINSKINTIKPYVISYNVFDYFVNNKERGLIYMIKYSDNNLSEFKSTILYLKQKGYDILSLDDILKE